MNDDDFNTLLEWYVNGFLDETPTKTNRRGVWHGDFDESARGRLSNPSHLAGGSRLGSPDQSITFQRYIQDGPWAKARGGGYARPFRAALADLTGRHRCTPTDRSDPNHTCQPSALMARFLFSLGMSQGDWVATTALFNITPSIRKAYTWAALKRLEARYTSYPLRRSWVDLSESQRQAEEAS